jgi:hypothetical protein
MIIFNTIKKAEHYVKWCNKNHDYDYDGYDWNKSKTYIEGKWIIRHESGDSCGCGCDTYLYDSKRKIGKIKAYDLQTIRASKLKNLIN